MPDDVRGVRPDVPSVPSPSAARRRLREISGQVLPWRVIASRLVEQAVYLGVFGGIAVQMVRSALAADGAGAGPAAPAGSTGVALVLSALAVGVALKVLLAVGPISVSAPVAALLASSPLDRRRLLVRTFVRIVVLSAVAGLLWPAVLFLLTGFGVTLTGRSVLVSATAAVACAGLAVCVQAGRPRRSRRGQYALSMLVGASAAALFADLLADGAVLRTAALDRAVDAAAGVAVVAVPGGACVLAVAGVLALGRLTRASLSSGRSVATGVVLSVTSFEFGLLGSITTERRAIEVGLVRSRPLGSRWWLLTLVVTDAVRLARAPGKLLAVVCLLLVPALFAAGASGAAAGFVPVVFTVAAFLVADRLAGTQRVVVRSVGLRRLLNLSRRRLDLGLSVVPLVGTAFWCLAARALTDGVSLAQVVVACLGSVLVVYRISTRPPLTFDDAAFFDVGILGPTPLGLVKQLSRGPTLLLALVLVQSTLL